MMRGGFLQEYVTRLAAALAVSLMVGITPAPRIAAAPAGALAYTEPVVPVAPTSMAQCNQLQEEYIALGRQLSAQASQCMSRMEHGKTYTRSVRVGPCAAITWPEPCAPLYEESACVQRRSYSAVAECRAEVRAFEETRKLAERNAEDAGRELLRRSGYGAEVGALDEARGTWATWKSRYQLGQDVAALASGQASWREQYDIVARNSQNAASAVPANPIAKAIIGEMLAKIVGVQGDVLGQLDTVTKQIEGFGGEDAGVKSRFGAALADMSRQYQQEVERQQQRAAEEARNKQREAETRRTATRPTSPRPTETRRAAARPTSPAPVTSRTSEPAPLSTSRPAMCQHMPDPLSCHRSCVAQLGGLSEVNINRCADRCTSEINRWVETCG